MAADPVFVDTNVLVYATRPLSAHHAAAEGALARLASEGSELWVSPQVFREYLAAVTRPQATAPALRMATAIADVRRFRAAFQVAEERPGVLDRLMHILATHRATGRQVHDANIVATMLDCGVRRLLTFNVADFRRFAPLIEIAPLP
jgi:predicted nucleic acid-binding protein